MTNIISVGTNDAPYVAFGDDSQTGDNLAYAFVIVRNEDIGEIEKRIQILKETFNIPPDIELHCRVLFNHHQRVKKGLGHLTEKDAKTIIEKAFVIINKNNLHIRYATASLSTFQNSVPPNIELKNSTDDTSVTMPVNYDPKGILGLLMQFPFSVPADGSKGPLATECKIVVSQDKTKITFMGDGRKRADRHYQGFTDVGAPEGTVFQLQPQVLTWCDAPILQLADICAYTCSHIKDAFFKTLLADVKHWNNATWQP